MKNKWIWISLGVAAGGTGLFFLGRFVKNKYFTKGLDESDVLGSGRPTPNPSAPSSSSSSGFPPTPFTNNTEGNAFRAWVNDNHPSYAREIDLDRTGAYDNSYIRKAFAKYGVEYQQSLTTGVTPSKPTASDFNLLRTLIGAFTKEEDTTEKLQIATSADRPRILIDFYPDGLMVVQKDSTWYAPVYYKISGSWKIQNSNLVLGFNGKTYTITPSDNNAVWTMLKDGGYLSVQDGSFIPFEGQNANMYQQTKMPSYIKDTIRNKPSLIGDLENELENF